MTTPQGVAVAFGEDWDDPDPTWTRVDTLAGCRVRGWQIDRGRPTEFDKTSTGTAVVRIADLDGLFDPTNPSSPYAGLIVPQTQAAICLQNPTGAHAWHTLFRGYVETWSYQLDPTRQYMEVELQLVDGFAILSRYQLRVGEDGVLVFTGSPEAEKLQELAEGNILYQEEPVDDRIHAVLADAGWPADLAETIVDVFTGNVRVGPKAYAPGTSALDALFDAADGEWPGLANIYIGGPGGGLVDHAGHVVFHGRQARFRPDIAEYGIQRRTVGDPDGIAAADTPADVVPVSELAWSLGGDNLFNSATATPQGVATGADWRQYNPGPPNNDPVNVVTDTTSVTAYGLRALTFDNLQTLEGQATGNTSLQETLGFAQGIVTNHKDPAPRITRMVFKSRHVDDPNADALWNHICRSDISDLLTLVTRHPGGGGFTLDNENPDEFYVEGLHMTCRPGSADEGSGLYYPVVELALDVSPRAHYTTDPFPDDEDPA